MVVETLLFGGRGFTAFETILRVLELAVAALGVWVAYERLRRRTETR